MPLFLGRLAVDVLRAAAVAAVGVLVRELIFMLDPRSKKRPYDDEWFEDE